MNALCVSRWTRSWHQWTHSWHHYVSHDEHIVFCLHHETHNACHIVTPMNTFVTMNALCVSRWTRSWHQWTHSWHQDAHYVSWHKRHIMNVAATNESPSHTRHIWMSWIWQWVMTQKTHYECGCHECDSLCVTPHSLCVTCVMNMCHMCCVTCVVWDT